MAGAIMVVYRRYRITLFTGDKHSVVYYYHADAIQQLEINFVLNTLADN